MVSTHDGVKLRTILRQPRVFLQGCCRASLAQVLWPGAGDDEAALVLVVVVVVVMQPLLLAESPPAATASVVAGAGMVPRDKSPPPVLVSVANVPDFPKPPCQRRGKWQVIY